MRLPPSPKNPEMKASDLLASTAFPLVNCILITGWLLSGAAVPAGWRVEQLASIGIGFSMLLVLVILRYQLFPKAAVRKLRVTSWILSAVAFGLIAADFWVGMAAHAGG